MTIMEKAEIQSLRNPRNLSNCNLRVAIFEESNNLLLRGLVERLSDALPADRNCSLKGDWTPIDGLIDMVDGDAERTTIAQKLGSLPRQWGRRLGCMLRTTGAS